MRPLYTNLEFTEAKGETQLKLSCYTCNKTFLKRKKHIVETLRGYPKKCGKFCSNQCRTKPVSSAFKLNCLSCNAEVTKARSQYLKCPNTFCSRSCSVSYHNKHKTKGIRRSKLEVWLEEQLTLLYPLLPIDFNKKNTIASELDIYIPSLNIAFELNGIFHYEPIFGVDKLGKIQDNDAFKTKACFDSKIDLCIIDTSRQSYVKPSTSKVYLDIIVDIIEERIKDKSANK
jgi:hypothetical protein